MHKVEWFELKFPPINLFNAPVRIAKCTHLAWMRLPSLGEKWCYDCGEKRDIANDMPIHQR